MSQIRVESQAHMQKLVTALPVRTTIRMLYKEDCAVDCLHLVGLSNTRFIHIEDTQYTRLLTIGTSGDWGGDQNRTIELKTTALFNPAWFAKRCYPAAETIEIIPPTT